MRHAYRVRLQFVSLCKCVINSRVLCTLQSSIIMCACTDVSISSCRCELWSTFAVIIIAFVILLQCSNFSFLYLYDPCSRMQWPYDYLTRAAPAASWYTHNLIWHSLLSLSLCLWSSCLIWDQHNFNILINWWLVWSCTINDPLWSKLFKLHGSTPLISQSFLKSYLIQVDHYFNSS